MEALLIFSYFCIPIRRAALKAHTVILPVHVSAWAPATWGLSDWLMWFDSLWSNFLSVCFRVSDKPRMKAEPICLRHESDSSTSVHQNYPLWMPFQIFLEKINPRNCMHVKRFSFRKCVFSQNRITGFIFSNALFSVQDTIHPVDWHTCTALKRCRVTNSVFGSKQSLQCLLFLSCFTLALSLVFCPSRSRGHALLRLVKRISHQFSAFHQFANCSQCFLSPNYVSINVMNSVFILLMSFLWKEKSERNKDFRSEQNLLNCTRCGDEKQINEKNVICRFCPYW